MSDADGTNDEHSVADAQGGERPVNYALYMRTDFGDADAIHAQREWLLAYVKARPGARVVVMLAELGAGMDLERDGLVDLFRWIERRDVDLVLVTDLARLALGVPQQLHVLLKLATAGVRLEVVGSNTADLDHQVEAEVVS
jgi:hypothetical protein